MIKKKRKRIQIKGVKHVIPPLSEAGKVIQHAPDKRKNDLNKKLSKFEKIKKAIKEEIDNF